VGLLSLARQQKAFFTSTTTTEVEAIHLSTDQLNRALILDPGVAAGLTAGAIRGLTLRLLRSEELQVERNELNAKLKKEQRRLAKALSALEAARLELIQQARFATLGELAAGVAHELNNPVAALTRAAATLAEEVSRLVASHRRDRCSARSRIHAEPARPLHRPGTAGPP
jgi:C4-dicarboxylate-specific signal transduction histidine kinase